MMTGKDKRPEDPVIVLKEEKTLGIKS